MSGFTVYDESDELREKVHGCFSARWYRRLQQSLIKTVRIVKCIPITLVYISPERMRKLHGAYYGGVKVTDVLSFAYEKSVDNPKKYGELFICVDQASKQAKRYHSSLEKELARLIVHGLLHIYGYNHVKKKERDVMNALTKKILTVFYKKNGIFSV